MRAVLPDVRSVIDDNAHCRVLVKESCQTLQLISVVLVAAEDAVAEVFALGIDDLCDGLGIGSGSHGVDVHLVELRNSVEKVLETRAHLDIVPVCSHIGDIVIGQLEALHIFNGVVIRVLGVCFPLGNGALAGGVDNGLVQIDNESQLSRAQQALLGVLLGSYRLLVADEERGVVVRHVHRRASDIELLGEVVDLGHVSATVDAEAAKLCLVGAWLFNLEKGSSTRLLAWRACSRYTINLPMSLNDSAGLDEPSRDLSFGARGKRLSELLHDGLLAAPLVALSDATVIAVGEQLARPLYFIVALLEDVEDGDGIAEIPGRNNLHSEVRQPMRLAKTWC